MKRIFPLLVFYYLPADSPPRPSGTPSSSGTPSPTSTRTATSVWQRWNNNTGIVRSDHIAAWRKPESAVRGISMESCMVVSCTSFCAVHLYLTIKVPGSLCRGFAQNPAARQSHGETPKAIFFPPTARPSDRASGE